MNPTGFYQIAGLSMKFTSGKAKLELCKKVPIKKTAQQKSFTQTVIWNAHTSMPTKDLAYFKVSKKPERMTDWHSLTFNTHSQ